MQNLEKHSNPKGWLKNETKNIKKTILKDETKNTKRTENLKQKLKLQH